MEAKLKNLRVAELRELLQKASVAIPAKSNKSDLIAKVLASPAALQAFDGQGTSAPAAKQKAPESSQGGQDDDLLAPPEEFDWGTASAVNGGAEAAKPTNAKAPVPATSTHTEKKSTAAQSSAAAQTTVTPSSSADAGKVDEELERRKKRAARFGVPLVEAKGKAAAASNGAKAASRPAKVQTQPAGETAKLEARAARFGVPTTTAKKPPAGGQKRARSPAPVEKEELERRKKRAERFSTGGEMKAKA